MGEMAYLHLHITIRLSWHGRTWRVQISSRIDHIEHVWDFVLWLFNSQRPTRRKEGGQIPMDRTSRVSLTSGVDGFLSSTGTE